MRERFARAWWALFAGVAVSASLGCDDDLPKATEIERMRLLGAKVEVVGDPSRATPRPGEEVDVRFVAVHPSLETDNDAVRTMLLSCTQPDRYTGGVPICQEVLNAALDSNEVPIQDLFDALAELIPDPEEREAALLGGFGCRELGTGVLSLLDTAALRCLDGEPDLRIRVAPSFEANELLYRGVVCQNGEAVFDPLDGDRLASAQINPRLFACDENDGETFLVHGTVTVQHEDEDANLNPSFDAAGIFLGNPGDEGGREWPFVDPDALPAEDDCWESADAAGVLRADSFGNHQITVRWDPDAREMVDGEPEDVEISLFATEGELGQRFVLFDEQSEIEGGMFVDTVSWTPPLEVESRSRIVRFFFTVLDRRGGFDWTTRALCLR